MGTVYGTNDAKVISEMLEGETIIINLESGNYYSLNDTGSVAWGLVKANADEDAMAAALFRRFDVETDVAAQAIRAFLDLLLAEGLVVVREDAPPAAAEPDPIEARLPFAMPAFEKYDDMQAMLLADPIHDVDEKGWPILKRP